jgi:hypothetical protein
VRTGCMTRVATSMPSAVVGSTLLSLITDVVQQSQGVAMKYEFRRYRRNQSLADIAGIAVTVAEMLVVACALSFPAMASDSKYAVDYTSEIDLLSSFNRPITQSLLPKHVKDIEYYPDDAIFPCSPAGVTLSPTRHPPRKCHYFSAVVGKDMPTLIFVLDGQRVTALIQEDHLDDGSDKVRKVRKLLHSWESDGANAPMVNGPNRAQYRKDHR